MVQATKLQSSEKFKSYNHYYHFPFSMMICQGCGVENNPGTSFCHGCGSKLVSQPGSLAASPGQASSAPCEGAEISCRHSLQAAFPRGTFDQIKSFPHPTTRWDHRRLRPTKCPGSRPKREAPPHLCRHLCRILMHLPSKMLCRALQVSTVALKHLKKKCKIT